MKFKIPIDYDAFKSDIPGQYFNGAQFVNGPIVGIEAELEFVATGSGSAAMGDVRRMEEYLKNDLNCAVMNLQAAQSMSVHTYRMAGGLHPHHIPGMPQNVQITMKVVLDPLINDTQRFAKLVEDEGRKMDMMLTRWSFSTFDRDVLYGQGQFKTRPTVKYKPTQVECCECHKEFLHTELTKDKAVWGDGDYQRNVESDTVCPRCGAWDCCELEFEQLPR